MKILLTIALSLFASTGVAAAELTAGPGAVLRLSEGQTGGLATTGVVFRDSAYAGDWELRAYWVGEQRIYGGAVVIDPYPAVSVSKLWEFRRGKFLRPVLGVGLLLKGSQRCHFDGDLDCNRQLPLPFGFLATAGLYLGDHVLLTAGHASNSSLDWGPEKKNLGLDHFRAEIVVARW